jgi:hypothetical protein
MALLGWLNPLRLWGTEVSFLQGKCTSFPRHPTLGTIFHEASVLRMVLKSLGVLNETVRSNIVFDTPYKEHHKKIY